MARQRYVSPELTHFAGRGKSEEEQYATLFAILRSRTLKSRGLHEGPVGPGGGLVIDPTAPLKDMFTTQVVCFCDIPLGDLALHAEKYSVFGLAFRKDFLLEKGANPVFYVADSQLGRPVSYLLEAEFGEERLRIALFEAGFRRLLESFVKPEPNSVLTTAWLRNFIAWYIGCFIKPFDPSKADDDPANFYMEREWRVLGKVDFGLDDVVRVFLAKRYFAHFRKELPEYVGQLQEV
jgi:Putative abortive phage resistance protein AbiGi, antitoxin